MASENLPPLHHTAVETVAFEPNFEGVKYVVEVEDLEGEVVVGFGDGLKLAAASVEVGEPDAVAKQLEDWNQFWGFQLSVGY